LKELSPAEIAALRESGELAGVDIRGLRLMSNPASTLGRRPDRRAIQGRTR
jgi:hypothetical protein